MNSTIYIDVLIIINFIINYFMILCTGKILGVKVKTSKAIFSAILGALSALSVFIDAKNIFILWFIRIITAFLMSFFSYEFRNIKSLFSNAFMLFTISFIFSGFMLMIYFLAPLDNMGYFNGIVYFDINPTILFILTIICYGILNLIKKILVRKNPESNYYKVQIKYNNKMILLDGFLDNGNKLKEPFSDFPVAISNLSNLKPLFSDEEINILSQTNNLICPDGFRIIPYNVLNGDGLIFGFIPDGLALIKNDKIYIVDEIYIAISNKSINHNDFNIILPANMFLEEKQKIKDTYLDFFKGENSYDKN